MHLYPLRRKYDILWSQRALVIGQATLVCTQEPSGLISPTSHIAYVPPALLFQAEVGERKVKVGPIGSLVTFLYVHLRLTQSVPEGQALVCPAGCWESSMTCQR